MGKVSTAIEKSGAHAFVGDRLLFTSEQNVEVEDAATEFKIWIETTQHHRINPHEYFFLTGANSKRASSQATMEDANANVVPATSDRGEGSITGELLKLPLEDVRLRALHRKPYSINANMSFGLKLNQNIAVYATRSQENHEGRRADLYLFAKSGSTKAKPRAEREEWRRTLTNCEAHLARWYLCNELKAVFCTLSTSTHKTLLNSFEPNVLIIDETTHYLLLAITIPIIVYGREPDSKDSRTEGFLESIVIVRDDDQGKQIKGVGKCNEAHDLMTCSSSCDLGMMIKRYIARCLPLHGRASWSLHCFSASSFLQSYVRSLVFLLPFCC
jgi:hypothetical protein